MRGHGERRQAPGAGDHVIRDHLLAALDAALVVDVPELGRQVLHAGRRPLHDDEHGLHAAAPGLYLWPRLDDQVLSGLMVALGTLAFRYDTTTTTPGSTGELAGP